MILNNIIRYHLLFFLFFLPSWTVIVAQASVFLGFKDYLSAGRYITFFSFFLLVFLRFFSCKNFFIGKKLIFGLGIISFYFFYTFLHLIGETGLFLKIEGLRHELLFVMMAFLLLAAGAVEKRDFLPSFGVVVASIVINGSIAIIFAIWQFFDVTILEFLYRESLEEIGNLTLAIGYRLTSTMINPINFGSYMVLFLISISYFYNQKKIGTSLYMILVITTFLMVAGSLSRLALLAFIFVLILSFFYRSSLTRLIIAALSITLFIFYAVSQFDIENLLARFEQLFLISTYTENARVSNWLYAIDQLDGYKLIWGLGLGASSPESTIVSEYSALAVENSFITVYVQYGLLGFVIFVAVIARMFLLGYRLGFYNFAMQKFIYTFLVFFLVMSLGNDFIRNSPFVFYFWFIYVYFELFLKEAACQKN